MSNAITMGIFWHLIGAASAACFYAPFKKVKKWSWEIRNFRSHDHFYGTIFYDSILISLLFMTVVLISSFAINLFILLSTS